MRPVPRISRALACITLMLCGSIPALAGVHLWRVKEIFSNADGTIQFIEIATCCGSTGENFLGGHVLTSNTSSFPFPGNVEGSTLNKHVLLATAGFAALPGAPTPDHIIGSNFLSTGGDTITFSFYDALTFPAGALPTDGTNSLNRNPNDPPTATFTALNSPTNYADQSGTVNAVTGPPGVPDGRGGTTPLTAAPLTPDASSLRVSFDARSCANAADHHILFGQRSGFPAAPGGPFTLLGSVCRIGTTTPYDWVGVPAPSDGSNLIWFLVVATDSRVVEGSWGRDDRGNERLGPGPNGSSGICATDRSLANVCGHPSQ
jgi:hypothetical protein